MPMSMLMRTPRFPNDRLDMQKIIVRYFLTNHVTFESTRKNYYITSCLINMKANETPLKQTRKFVNKNLKK